MMEESVLDASAKARRVLIVEDDLDFAESLSDLLIPHRYEVRVSTDPDGALCELGRFEADVAFIDLRLGRTDGLDLVSTLQHRRPKLLCVIMTAYASVETAVSALHAGVYDYLVKPFHPDALLALLRRACERIELEETKIRAERALELSRRRFRDFAEASADWFWETDAELRISYLSSCSKCSGEGDEASLLGRSIDEVFLKRIEDTELWAKQVNELARRRLLGEFEIGWPHGIEAQRVLRITGKPVFDAREAFCGYRGTARDVTEAHRLSTELTYQASHDPLTGLVNRREFERRLRQALSGARSRDWEHALCYLDLDQFKVVNDTCGHVAGDELLRQLGVVIQEQVRKRDTLARLGGDEFGVLIEHCTLSQAGRVADVIRKAVEQFRFRWEDKSFSLGVSIGLVPINAQSESISSILSAADAACYAAKDRGRNRVHVYEENDEELSRRYGEMQWVSEITSALETNRLRLYCQPIVPLYADRPAGAHYELLLRLEGPQAQLIPPGAFLPAADRYNLSVRVDHWVINRAIELIGERPHHLESLFLCCINISGPSLGDDELRRHVMDALGRNPGLAQKLCFEITESAAMTNLPSTTGFIRSLRSLGCKFALDDFGIGLSSFAYLKTLPVDFIKIDGIFVKDIAKNPIDLSMVRSINDIGRVMGKKTVAEFVESDAVLQKLKGIGVDYAQGFVLGEPMPLQRYLDGA